MTWLSPKNRGRANFRLFFDKTRRRDLQSFSPFPLSIGNRRSNQTVSHEMLTGSSLASLLPLTVADARRRGHFLDDTKAQLCWNFCRQLTMATPIPIKLSLPCFIAQSYTITMPSVPPTPTLGPLLDDSMSDSCSSLDVERRQCSSAMLRNFSTYPLDDLDFEAQRET